MTVLIMNPAYPKDKTKARPLSQEQLDVAREYIVYCMNYRKLPKDDVIIKMLNDANVPISFD